MKNFSGVCQAAGADKPLRAFFIWITNIVTLLYQKELRNVQWVFITIAQVEELEIFINDYPIHLLPYSFLLREDFPRNHLLFGVSVPPVLFIYDDKGKLINVHKGGFTLFSILDELR